MLRHSDLKRLVASSQHKEPKISDDSLPTLVGAANIGRSPKPTTPADRAQVTRGLQDQARPLSMCLQESIGRLPEHPTARSRGEESVSKFRSTFLEDSLAGDQIFTPSRRLDPLRSGKRSSSSFMRPDLPPCSPKKRLIAHREPAQKTSPPVRACMPASPSSPQLSPSQVTWHRASEEIKESQHLTEIKEAPAERESLTATRELASSNQRQKRSLARSATFSSSRDLQNRKIINKLVPKPSISSVSKGTSVSPTQSQGQVLEVKLAASSNRKTQSQQRVLDLLVPPSERGKPRSSHRSNSPTCFSGLSSNFKRQATISENGFSCEISPLIKDSEIYENFSRRVAFAMQTGVGGSSFFSESSSQAQAHRNLSQLPPRPEKAKSRPSLFREASEKQLSNKAASFSMAKEQQCCHSSSSNLLDGQLSITEARSQCESGRIVRKVINQYVILNSLKCQGDQKMKLVLSRNDKQRYAMRVVKRAHKNHNTVSYIANLMSLKHPNLINFIQAIKSSSGDKLYLITELTTGGSVQDLIKKRGAVPLPLCHSFFKQLLLGLEHCYTHATVPLSNLNIHTSNLLLDNDRRTLKLAFFSPDASSRLIIQQNNKGDFYLPPQVIEGFTSDQKSDLWRCGVVLYRMLIGKYPFRGQNRQILLKSISEDELDLPWRLKPMLRDLLSRLLEKDRTKRISLEEVREHDWVTSNGLFPLNLQSTGGGGSTPKASHAYQFSRLKVKGKVEVRVVKEI